MRISDPQLRGHLAERGVDLRPGAKLSEWTSLGIGGTTDMLRITKHASIPDLLGLLEASRVPHRFLGGGSNLLVDDGELPWVVLQLVPPEPDVVLEGNLAHIDAAADLGRTVTFCAKHDLGGMEGLIGVPGTVGGALRMNAGAYGMQIGTYVREVQLYRAAARKIETLRGHQISFEYRHTSFAADDMMLAVILELPSKPYNEILNGIRICNEKRRSSQPLGQKSAGWNAFFRCRYEYRLEFRCTVWRVVPISLRASYHQPQKKCGDIRKKFDAPGEFRFSARRRDTAALRGRRCRFASRRRRHSCADLHRPCRELQSSLPCRRGRA